LNVINLMMPVVVGVSPETPVRDAIKLMLQHHVSGLPVIDEEQKLVGIVSEGDLLRRAEIGTQQKHNRWLSLLLSAENLAAEYVRSHGCKVRDIMTPDPITACENTPIEEVARLMEKHHIKRLPVMRGTKLVGIVSRADLVRAVMKHGATMQSPAKTDQDIRAQIIEKIRTESWSPFPLIDVEVSAGRVKLKGTVFFQRQRDGLKIVAENTAGVKEVVDELTWVEPLSTAVVSPPEGVFR